jgi:hypothetical protein
MRITTTVATLILGLMVGTISARQGQVLYTGIGGGLGVAIVDGAEPVDGGVNFDFHGDIAFDLGKAGELHYIPSLSFWVGNDENAYYDYTALQFLFNAFDLRYYPPIPSSPVRPFFGMAPTIVISHMNIEYFDEMRFDSDDSELSAGFNLYAGADFRLNSTLRLFTELRGTFGSDAPFVANWREWDSFRPQVGLTWLVSGKR